MVKKKPDSFEAGFIFCIDFQFITYKTHLFWNNNQKRRNKSYKRNYVLSCLLFVGANVEIYLEIKNSDFLF